jgi:hypothetical protein
VMDPATAPPAAGTKGPLSARQSQLGRKRIGSTAISTGGEAVFRKLQGATLPRAGATAE